MDLKGYLNKLKHVGDFYQQIALPQKVTDIYSPGYDYAGYREKYGEPDMSGGKHLTDEFKLPEHITFSDDSSYSGPGREGGKWRKNKDGQWTFEPSEFNLQQHSPEKLKEYFDNYSKQDKLILP